MLLHAPSQPPVSGASEESSQHHGINTPSGGNQFRPSSVGMQGKYFGLLLLKLVSTSPLSSLAVHMKAK